MDSTYRTPLLDCFRRGEASIEVRRLAAAGQLAPRAHEQLALLVLLAGDEDPEIRALTEQTIARLPRGPVAAFLARSDVHEDIRAFFANRGLVQEDAAPGGDSASPLLPFEADAVDAGPGRDARSGDAPGGGDEAEERTEEGAGPATDAADAEADDAEAGRRPRAGVAQRLALLDVGRKVKVAMLGTREERNVLIRDSNRIVAAAVLSSPKLTESEVESIARMANVSDEVLRIVGTSRAWTKNYNVISALTRNPKTPIAISLTLMSRLTSRDMKMLSTDRNVPEPLRVAARKQVIVGDSRKQ